MKTLSFAFFVTLYLVFTHINCGIESSSVKKRCLKEWIEQKNQSDEDFNVFMVRHLNKSALNGFDEGEETLMRGQDELEEIGKHCLKNTAKCRKDGK